MKRCPHAVPPVILCSRCTIRLVAPPEQLQQERRDEEAGTIRPRRRRGRRGIDALAERLARLPRAVRQMVERKEITLEEAERRLSAPPAKQVGR
jgi:hypothetical protein